MASLTLERLTDMVALRLGEFPDCRLTAPADGQCSLGEMIEVGIEEAARHITRSASLSDFSESTDLTPFFAGVSPDVARASMTLTLPPDFCRLLSIRFPDWGVTLDEEHRGDRLRSELCETAPEWLRHRSGRPWLRLTCGPGRARITCGPTTSTLPSEAGYVSLPSYDSAARILRQFDPALTERLITHLISQFPS